MGYVKQDFKSGDKLYASQLNAMDEQIARNEAALDEKQPKGDYPTKAEVAEGYQPKGDYPTKTEMNDAIANAQLGGGETPDTSSFLTKTEAADVYVKKTGMKTINGQSLVGEGDITIEGGEAVVSEPYTQLMYIEGTSGQSVKTNYYIEENDTIELDYAITDYGKTVSGDKYILYAPKGDGQYTTAFQYYGDNKKLYFRFGASSSTSVTNSLTSETQSGTLVMTKSSAVINGKEITTLTYGGQPESPMQFFSTTGSYAKVYGCRIYRDGQMIHNFVPYKRNEDGAIGVLDVITNEFFANGGTNPLLYKEVEKEYDYYTREQLVPKEQFTDDDFVSRSKDFLLKQGTTDTGESKLFPLLSTSKQARCFAIDLIEGHTYQIKVKNNAPDSTTWRMRIALWEQAYSDIKFVPAKQDDVQNIAPEVGTPAEEVLISTYQKDAEYETTFTNTNGYKTLMGLLAWGVDYSYLEVSVKDMDADSLTSDIKVTMGNITREVQEEITEPWSKYTKKPISKQDNINLTNVLVSNMARCNEATKAILELAYDFWRHREEFMYSNGTARDNAWNYWSEEGYYDVNTGNTITAENAGWKKIDCSTFVYYVTAGIGYYSSPYYNMLEWADVEQGALVDGVDATSDDVTVCRTSKMQIRPNRPLKLESADSSKYKFTKIFGYAEDGTLVQTLETVSIGTTFTPDKGVMYLRAEMKVESSDDYAPAVTEVPKAPATILKRLRIRENEQLAVRGLCPNSQRYAKSMCQWYDDNGYGMDYNRWHFAENDFKPGTIMWWGRTTATSNYKYITHITIYIGSGYLIHSSTGNMGLKGGQGIHIQTLEDLFGSYTEPLSGAASPEYHTDYSAEKKLLGIE